MSQLSAGGYQQDPNKTAMYQNHNNLSGAGMTTADNSAAYMMMNQTAENHTRNLTELPRDQTLMMEESKSSNTGYQSRHAPNNASQGDFLAGLGIMPQHSKTMAQGGRPQSV